MNFGSNSVKLNKFQTYNNVGNNTDYFKNINKSTDNYDTEKIIDYSNYSKEPEDNIDWSIDYTANDAIEKLGKNALFYGISDVVKESFGVKSSAVIVLITTGAKFISTGEVSFDSFRDDVLIGGTVKKSTTEIINKNITKKIELNVTNTILKRSGLEPIKSAKAFEELAWKSMQVKATDTLDDFELFMQRQYFTNFAKSQMASLGAGTIVDYAASVGVNAITAFVNGEEVNAKTLKLGTTFLKSSWKTIGAKAFETIGFAVMGPKGKIIGKTLGTIVGATIGDFVVSAFDKDETWCAIAGGATIAGAVGASAIFTTLIATGAITCSIPVAGWIVGGAMIVGALIGSGITWLIYKCSGG